MRTINDVALMSRLISNKSTQIDKLELKKMFIITMASVPDPSAKEKELALKELEKPFEERNMQKIVSNNVIKISKQEFFKLMKVDIEKNRTAYDTYKKLWTELVKSSHYTFDDGEDFITGNFITNAYTRKNMSTFNITIDPNYMPVFWHLKGGYIKLLTEDIAGFDSKFSMDLYKKMMNHSNKKELDFTTKQLKEIFGLSENDYMRKNQSFDRKNFEKYTIERALKELDEKCKSITIFKNLDKNGNKTLFRKTYKKDKNGNDTRFVDKYVIRYLVTDPYDVINSEKDSDVLPGQLEMEFPRSRRKTSSKQLPMVGIDKNTIDKVNSSLYNWLED